MTAKANGCQTKANWTKAVLSISPHVPLLLWAQTVFGLRTRMCQDSVMYM